MRWIITKIEEGPEGDDLITIRVRKWHPKYWRNHFRSRRQVAETFSIPFLIWFPTALVTLFEAKPYENHAGEIDIDRLLEYLNSK